MVYSHRVFIILMLGCMMWICTCYNMEAKIRERAYKGALMMLNGRLKQVGINAENQYTMLADIIIPLWKYTYDEQLVVKQTHAYNFMNIFRNYANTSGIVGDLSKIIASPAPKHYRNRDDLSIFYNINGDKKIIGHYIERNSDFLPVCVAPVNITTIKPRTMEIIRMLQNFLDISPLPASASFNSFGFWRGAVVHSTGKGDIMIIVQTNSGLMTPAEMEVEIENLRNYVAKMEPNSTLYNQVYTYSTQLSMLGLPYILLLHGEPYMYDYIENYKFKISPGVKFPVNTQSGEVLYREVFRLAGLKKDNIILDLYCGIGIISILAADKVRASIGIDESPSNIEEAKANALLNNVTNTIFMAGYINKVLMHVWNRLTYISEVVAVIHATHEGVSKMVIRTIQSQIRIRTLIYVATIGNRCVHGKGFGYYYNLADLIRPTKASNRFALTAIVPVDTLPQTKQYSIIFQFNRLTH